MNAFTLPGTDGIFIHGKLYSKKKLCLDWFQMSNDGFYDLVVDGEKVKGRWVEGSLLTYKDGTTFVCREDYIPDVLNKEESQ